VSGFFVLVSATPGNSLRVSGISHRGGTRELEAAFAKIGRVRLSLIPPLKTSYI